MKRCSAYWTYTLLLLSSEPIECWRLIDLTLRNIFHWNWNQNTIIFFQKKSFKMLPSKYCYSVLSVTLAQCWCQTISVRFLHCLHSKQEGVLLRRTGHLTGNAGTWIRIREIYWATREMGRHFDRIILAPGPRFNTKTIFLGIWIHIIKIKRYVHIHTETLNSKSVTSRY